MKRRIGFIILIANLAIFLIFGIVTVRLMHNDADSRIFSSLDMEARLLSWEINDNDGALPEGLMGKRAREMRVTITVLDNNGDVLLDSVLAPSMIANQANENEIIDALDVGIGKAVRYNSTQGKTRYYVARKLADGTILRLSQTSEEIDAQYNNSNFYIAMLLFAMIALSLFSYWLIIRWTVAPLQGLLTGMRAITTGDYSMRLQSVDQEITNLCDAYNTMADRLERTFTTLTQKQLAMSGIMNNMQIGILAVDKQLQIILVNPAAKRLLGIVGSTEGIRITDASKDVNIEELLTSAMQQAGIYTGDVAARTNVGRSRRPLRLYVTSLRENDNLTGAMALIEDITELRRLEQVRTDFAANVSHELRTPLTSIKGFVETLLAGALHQPERAEKFLKIIALETDRLARLINDILSLSKLESGDDEVAMDAIRLDVMAQDVCEMLRVQAEEKHITVHCSESAPAIWIWANNDRTKQMLINLIGNAVKYTLDGGSVTVAVYKLNGEACLSVSDTGIGIAEEHMPRLFERFYRVDKGRSRAMGGTGLGLAIVKHILRTMNGHIEVHSKLGVGTEFLITIPLCDEELANNAKNSDDDWDV